MLKWIIARLKEPSTMRGLVWLATVAGLSLRPDQAEAIVTAGMALAGLLGVFLSDDTKPVRIDLPPIDLQARPESGAVTPAPNESRVPSDDERSKDVFRFGHTQWIEKPPGFVDRD